MSALQGTAIALSLASAAGAQAKEETHVTGVDERLLVMAGDAQVGWILTGEDETLDTRIRPAHDLAPAEGDRGAVELGSRVVLGSAGRATLLDLATDLNSNSTRMGCVTGGVSGGTPRHVRVSLGGLREQDSGDVLLQPTKLLESRLPGSLTRFQVDFQAAPGIRFPVFSCPEWERLFVISTFM